jgi:hypothetical protein
MGATLLIPMCLYRLQVTILTTNEENMISYNLGLLAGDKISGPPQRVLGIALAHIFCLRNCFCPCSKIFVAITTFDTAWYYSSSRNIVGVLDVIGHSS